MKTYFHHSPNNKLNSRQKRTTTSRLSLKVQYLHFPFLALTCLNFQKRTTILLRLPTTSLWQLQIDLEMEKFSTDHKTVSKLFHELKLLKMTRKEKKNLQIYLNFSLALMLIVRECVVLAGLTRDKEKIDVFLLHSYR